MSTYLVTGGTGVLGRNLLARRAARPEATVQVLVRRTSVGRLERIADRLGARDRIAPVIGDIRADRLDLDEQALTALEGVDHVVHLAALYDMTGTEADNEDLNIGGTQRVLEVASRVHAGRFHHVSSIAVAGEHRGTFHEGMFDEGQHLPSAYHRTKFEAEKLVRSQPDVPWRVYRPSVVVGDSRTGEIDRPTGPTTSCL